MPKLVEICRVDHEVSTPRCTKARTRGAGLGVRAGLASCDSVQIMFHLALPVNTHSRPHSLPLVGYASPGECARGYESGRGYTHYEDLGVSIQGQDANHLRASGMLTIESGTNINTCGFHTVYFLPCPEDDQSLS